MPDVKLRYPDDLFETDDAATEYREGVAVIVANDMECWEDRYDTDSDPNREHFVTLDPEKEIDIIARPYKAKHGRTGAAVMIEIAAYAYQDRMESMPARLKRISESAKALLQNGGDVSTSFVPLPEGCWYTTAS